MLVIEAHSHKELDFDGIKQLIHRQINIII